jgi:hypothetical protein
MENDLLSNRGILKSDLLFAEVLLLIIIFHELLSNLEKAVNEFEYSNRIFQDFSHCFNFFN